MQISEKEFTVLGVDPGYKRIGYGIIGYDNGHFVFLDAGMLRTPSRSHESPLAIATALDNLIVTWRPSLFAVEKVYFGQNKTSVLAVSEIKGMIVLGAHKHNLPIVELTPLEVKMLVCGYGRADKAAVRKIITAMFPAARQITSKDAIDGVAIALAGYYRAIQQRRIEAAENAQSAARH